jgi:hypothetical protein
MAQPQIWRIQLLVETDDPEQVQSLADRVGLLACAVPGANHECDPPWFVITSPVDASEVDDWRDLLNR